MKQDKHTVPGFGFGESDITPSWPEELVGFYRDDEMSKGVRHCLKAQVLICSWQEEICCLMAVDSIGFTVELTNQLRGRVARQLNCTADKIMICFSHTHAAPNAAASPRYFEFVCQRVSAAVKEALQSSAPLHAAWGVGICEIGVNRRGEEGAVDNRLGVLELAHEGGRAKLLVLRVTAHTNVLSSDNWKISSDYFGAARRAAEQRFGCKVMMIQGAAGNIRPKYQQENAIELEICPQKTIAAYTDQCRERFFQQSEEALKEMAQEICRATEGLLKNMKPQPVWRLQMKSQRHLFQADVPGEDQALKIAAEAKEAAGIDGSGWLQEVKRLEQEGVRVQQAEIEVQGFFLNEGCFCGVANEAMCEIALEIQERSGTPLLFFNGYTNGVDSYFPTAEEYDKGGYEVLWSNLIYYPYHGRVMPLNRNTAEEMVDIVTALGRIPPEKRE